MPSINGHRIVAVKLLVGLLYPKSSKTMRDWTMAQLIEVFGDIERESEVFDFACTNYYRNISPELERCFFSFKGLLHPSGLADWKKLAIELEAKSSIDDRPSRRVNIDPGYIDGARVVLASTKDNAHRVYLCDGIYAEITLCRRKFGWEKFSYTFPDFKSGQYDVFMELVRRDWQNDIRKLKQSVGGIDR